MKRFLERKMNQTNQTIIKLHKLSKVYGKEIVLKDINLDINAGEIFGIIGKSGAGKTTLLETIIGFRKPSKGNVYFHLNPVLSKKRKEFSRFITKLDFMNKLFGFSRQQCSFYENLTVEENLMFFGTMYGLSPKIVNQNIKHLLAWVGLGNHKLSLAKNLSKGMQKRLDIACALVHDPKILLLDEPTADLDPVLRQNMWDLIKKINSVGITVIIASHFLDDIKNYCHRVALLNNKSIVGVGSPQRLADCLKTHEQITLHTYPGDYYKIYNYLLNADGIKNIEQKNNSLVIHVEKSEFILPYLLNAVDHYNEVLLSVDVEKNPLTRIMGSFR